MKRDDHIREEEKETLFIDKNQKKKLVNFFTSEKSDYIHTVFHETNQYFSNILFLKLKCLTVNFFIYHNMHKSN